MHDSSGLHPVHACYDGFINSKSGKKINLVHPAPDMFDMKDIAAALSKICRFGGQSSVFYSVAQHSMLVAALAPDNLKREALLHDAAEAYLGDVVKPLKILLGETYGELETRFEHAIGMRFGVELHPMHPRIKELDRYVLELEHEALQKSDPDRLIKELHAANMILTNTWAFDPAHAQMYFYIAFITYFNKGYLG